VEEVSLLLDQGFKVSRVPRVQSGTPGFVLNLET
jgi:hypothetical protein